MERSHVACPRWLAELLKDSGGSTSFYHFMDWALNDQHNGAYSCGRIKVGKKGDFVTFAPESSHFSYTKIGCLLLVFQRARNELLKK